MKRFIFFSDKELHTGSKVFIWYNLVILLSAFFIPSIFIAPYAAMWCYFGAWVGMKLNLVLYFLIILMYLFSLIMMGLKIRFFAVGPFLFHCLSIVMVIYSWCINIMDGDELWVILMTIPVMIVEIAETGIYFMCFMRFREIKETIQKEKRSRGPVFIREGSLRKVKNSLRKIKNRWCEIKEENSGEQQELFGKLKK